MDAHALVARGGRELSENRTLKALATYTQAVLLDPQAAIAYDGLGAALAAEDDSDKAIVCFKAAIRLGPMLIEPRYGMGCLLAARGEHRQAVDVWRELLEIDPNQAKTHERVAISLYAIEDYSGSWRHVHAAETLGHRLPPQLRPLLEAKMPEPQ